MLKRKMIILKPVPVWSAILAKAIARLWIALICYSSLTELSTVFWITMSTYVVVSTAGFGVSVWDKSQRKGYRCLLKAEIAKLPYLIFWA